MNTNKILDTFLENIGLFDNIFGKNTEKIILNRERETIKNILIEVYGYNDELINRLFPTEVDDDRLDRTLEKLFRFSSQNYPPELEQKK